MRYPTLAATAVLVAAPALLAAPAAHALTPQTVFGTVSCKSGARSSPPSAVWVNAEKGESGWAKVDDIPDAHGWVKSYTFTTNDAGRFRMVVACGGTEQAPSQGVLTDWMKPGRHNLVANF